ncbi:unnamed protein product [Albugo candida]|uniref:Uncharacterized protein n=1 Tax=Albugo candida TaxID=65357 RepID=A0A024GEH6_9STRA|nr:unnamed protein product [Albugo candida]|eukprot:CCI45094.1 unnamed protein product [Albugo candida]
MKLFRTLRRCIRRIERPCQRSGNHSNVWRTDRTWWSLDQQRRVSCRIFFIRPNHFHLTIVRCKYTWLILLLLVSNGSMSFVLKNDSKVVSHLLDSSSVWYP